ncbi:DUF2865 domain-containing protein [Brucella intermedia]|uniref:DUF2865 domain-containing protein n=1 Tax=Brucella TaxID=234 RepID=UPI0009467116|nr:DUF2865 domain-containing protein [Brucella intermedia]
MHKPKYLLIFGAILYATNTAEIALAQDCRLSVTTATDLVAKRQLAALYNMQRARNCSTDERGGGIFNPCRDLANQIAAAQRSASADQNCAPAPNRLQRKSNRTLRSSRADTVKKVSFSRPKEMKVQTPKKTARSLLYCVRLTDGYLFPAPHSQFKQKGGEAAALAQCKFICETDSVDLYRLNDHSNETADLMSVSTGQLYIDLPTAFNYHDAAEFKKCNWTRYIDTVARRKLAQTRTHFSEDFQPPIPVSRPVGTVSSSIRVIQLSAFAPLPDRKLRVVGPPFVFDNTRPLKKE